MGAYNQSDGSKTVNKSEKLDIESQNSEVEALSLKSLSKANVTQLRVIAANNLKYYPEHISTLLEMLNSEGNSQVNEAIDMSLRTLTQSEKAREEVINTLRSFLEKDTCDNEECKRHIELILARLLDETEDNLT